MLPPLLARRSARAVRWPFLYRSRPNAKSTRRCFASHATLAAASDDDPPDLEKQHGRFRVIQYPILDDNYRCGAVRCRPTAYML